MNSIRYMNELASLINHDTQTINEPEPMHGGKPAIDRIEEIFMEGGKADVTGVDKLLAPETNKIKGGDAEVELEVEDDDGKIPVAMDDAGDPINDPVDTSGDEDRELELNIFNDEIQSDAIMHGGAGPIQRVTVLTADSKFPWVFRKRTQKK